MINIYLMFPSPTSFSSQDQTVNPFPPSLYRHLCACVRVNLSLSLSPCVYAYMCEEKIKVIEVSLHVQLIDVKCAL